jgi:hypothetical protein
MVMIKRYWSKEGAGGRLYIVSLEVSVCPVCGEVLVVIGSRERKIKGSESDVMILVIRRLRCKFCRVIHHELPDIVMPYKRHGANTIEKVIAGEGDWAHCAQGTIGRIRAWWSSCLLYFESVLASLREKYGLVFSVKSAPREIIRAVVNAHLWVHTRSAVTPI